MEDAAREPDHRGRVELLRVDFPAQGAIGVESRWVLMNETKFGKLMAALAKVLRDHLVNPLSQYQAQADAERKKQQDDCLHMKGSLGSFAFTNQGTSIWWHTFEDDDPRFPKGVCSHCQRVFRVTDPDYHIWRAKKSTNLPSTCGFPRTGLPDEKPVNSTRDFPIDALYERPVEQTLAEFVGENR
jgi:hypothetical protein